MIDLLSAWQWPQILLDLGGVEVKLRSFPPGSGVVEVLFPNHSGVTVDGEEKAVRVSFWDGGAFEARPGVGGGAVQTRKSMGYPEDAEGQWAFCWEREILHALAMRWLGWPYSPVQRKSVELGRPWNPLEFSEEMGLLWETLVVGTLQQYLMDGRVPGRADDPPDWLIVSRARREASGLNWVALGMAARALLEEVRRMAGEP